jgi:anti-anti-sigma regulatory factor
MLKIEKESDGQTTIIWLTGRIQSKHLDEIMAQIDDDSVRIILDLSEVTLVDVEAVRFLSARQKAGVELFHCPPYVREWIFRERAEGVQG